MSMPQPIHVVLMAATADCIRAAKRHFRLGTPGLGPPYYAALDAPPQGEPAAPESLPKGRVTLWLCLDQASLQVALELHSRDLADATYDRGFYEDLFPEACVLLQGPQTLVHDYLSAWAKRISDAWYATS